MESFRTVTRNYYRNAHAAVYVYSVSEASSLHYLSQWIKDTQNFAPDAIRMLVGNKLDLEAEIDFSTIESFAIVHKFELQFLISCKTDSGISEAFEQLARALHNSARGSGAVGDKKSAVGMDGVVGGEEVGGKPQPQQSECDLPNGNYHNLGS